MSFFVLFAAFFGLPAVGEAGSPDELKAALDHYYTQGEITDLDARNILLDLITKLQSTADPEAQAAYRAALIDVITAYTGAGIADAAAADLTHLAEP